jgi:hypothetical protein
MSVDTPTIARYFIVRPEIETWLCFSTLTRQDVKTSMEQSDFPESNLALALPAPSVNRDLLALGFPRRDIAALFEQTEFLQIPYKSHQVCFLRDYARDILGHALGTKELAALFERNERTVRKTLARGPQDPGPLGRHAALESDGELSLVATLLDAFGTGKSMTCKEFLQLVRERHNPHLTKGWVHAFLGRHRDELQLCRSLPQEETRMAVPRAYLDEHINVLKTHLAEKVAELVFDLDELGSSDWEDRKVKKIIAPSAVRKEDVHHAVSRRHRHVTLLACVSAAGDALTPLIVTTNAIRDSLWSRGLRQDEDAMVRRRTPAYVDEELFFEYISTVFIPYVATVRDRPGLENEFGVLLMDSAPAHMSDRVLRLLGENKIIAITFPAHTTNLFQALDLVFFGALKKLKATAVGEFEDDSVNAQITKLIQAFEQTATSATIRGAFRKAGLELDVSRRPFKVKVVEERLRDNPGFREVWERNAAVEALSSRRQAHRFGIINSEFLDM